MANRKITDLVALTTPAQDDVIPIVDISETSNSTKNKKITAANLLQGTPSISLKFADGTASAPSVAFTTATTTGLYRSAANELSIATNGGQAIKVEANNKTTIYGDLVVTGGTTTISSTQIDVTDKNLQLATGNSSDSGADGGGLTLKGATDKTWNWVDSTDSWTANQHIDVTTGKVFKIAGTEVLSATTLGTAVVNSSLTSVGTLGSLTVTNAVTAGSLDISGGADIDGTLEADAYTVDGTALNEYIADTVGAMVSSNTETNITVTYEDSDNTLDFVIGTLNQDTTGNAATATALETARTIGGVSFNGTANINLPGVNQTGNQNTTGSAATLTTARTIGGVSFDGSANINLPGVNAAGNQNTSGTAAGLSGTPNITVADVIAASLDISGNADIDGTLEADAITVDGTALNEFIADTVGAMVSSNTETNIVVTYDDSDNTLDFVISSYPAASISGTTLASNVVTSSLTSVGTLGSLTVTNAVTAGSLDISGGVDVDGTLEADAITVDGTALNEYIADTVGAMVSSNTESDIVVTYQDSDNTLDFTVSNISGNAGTATALQNARTIGGVSFDGTANIDLPGVNTAGNQNTSGTAAGLTGTPNITVGVVTAASLDISGNADIDGTLEADAITVDGTALNEYISDTIGAMVGSNTETGITVTYDDSDNTLDFVIGTLNQDTTGTAALATEFTVTANNSTDETVYPTFVDGATGSQGAETDTALTYNPSTGLLSSTVFGGSGANLTNLNASQLSSGTIAAARLSTATTQSASNNSTKIATTAYVDTAVSNLVDGSPGALNTLNELAAALGDDANFSTTVTNSIAAKLPLAGGTMSGAINLDSNNITNGGTITGTFVGNITGNVTGNTSGSAGSCTGNAATATTLATARTIGGTSFDGSANIAVALAATATALATARTIGGVSFDGTGNIDLPGVNSAGNQNTSGTSAGLTGTPNITVGVVTAGSLDISGNVDVDGTLETDALTIDGVSLAETIADTVGAMVGSNTETGITVTYDDSDNTLDFVVASLNQDTTGNAATATALETARTINGVSFDGTGNITVTAAAGTLTGNTLASGVTASSLTSVGTLTGLTVSGNISMTGTGAIDVPAGTTAQRPGSPSTGLFRYNSTEGEFEGYTASGWGAIAGGGGGTSDFKYLALRNAANNGAASYPASDFTLVTSGTTNAISPTAANVLLVSVGGVIQQPNTGTSTPSSGFAISGSTIKFGSNISAAPDFIIYQVGAGVGTPSDGTVTEAKLSVSNSPTNGYFLSAQSGNTGGLTWATVPAGVGGATGVDFNDNVKARFGTSNDLEIFHNSINSQIVNSTGGLYTDSGTHYFRNAAGNETLAFFQENGKVELHYDNSKKLETTSYGAFVSGHVKLGDNSRVYFGDGDDMWIGWNGSDGEVSLASGALYMHDDIIFYDDKKAKFGSGGDLEIYHNGTHSYITDSGTGNLNINASQVNIHNPAANEACARFIADGAVQLYYDSSKKFETTNGGVEVASGNSLIIAGTNSSSYIQLKDNAKFYVGTGNDLQIYHSGSHSFISNTTGTLQLENAGNITITKGGTENMARFIPDGAVELYYDNAKKIETTSAGVTVTGTVTATSYAGDGSSLTGVASATADGCLYENSQTISNNYTIASGKGAHAVGPLAISATLTVNGVLVIS